MAEDQRWLICTSPRAMLQHLRGVASVRKNRLFLCACYRRLWHFATDERVPELLELAERCADGQVTRKELAAALRSANARGAESTVAYGEAHQIYYAAWASIPFKGEDQPPEFRAARRILLAGLIPLLLQPDGTLSPATAAHNMVQTVCARATVAHPSPPRGTQAMLLPEVVTRIRSGPGNK